MCNIFLCCRACVSLYWYSSLRFTSLSLPSCLLCFSLRRNASYITCALRRHIESSLALLLFLLSMRPFISSLSVGLLVHQRKQAAPKRQFDFLDLHLVSTIEAMKMDFRHLVLPLLHNFRRFYVVLACYTYDLRLRKTLYGFFVTIPKSALWHLVTNILCPTYLPSSLNYPKKSFTVECGKLAAQAVCHGSVRQKLGVVRTQNSFLLWLSQWLLDIEQSH